MFTSAQNRALRGALHEFRERESCSQAALGEALGISQQTASRLLEEGGFSYAPATALVRRLGFGGVDKFFEAKGVALSHAG